MSRIKVYNRDNLSRYDFRGVLSRGWTVEGSQSVSGGGSTTVLLDEVTASSQYVGPGRMASAWHEKLQLGWAGMIDTPWKANLPVEMTVYGQAYLLSLRAPDAPEMLIGDVYEIAAQIIERINAQEEMYLRLGDVEGEDITRQETLDMRPYWDQLRSLVGRAGKQAFLRPQNDGDGHLITYVDIKNKVGAYNGFLLHDGHDANVQVLNATLDGKIINSLVGLGSGNTDASRLRTTPQRNQDSIDLYRLRSGSVQYQGVVDETTLLRNTNTQLDFSSWPKLKIPLKILDKGDTFRNVRPGGGYMLHLGELYLPFGKRGFRGGAYLTALAYDEPSETVSALAEVLYVPRD